MQQQQQQQQQQHIAQYGSVGFHASPATASPDAAAVYNPGAPTPSYVSAPPYSGVASLYAENASYQSPAYPPSYGAPQQSSLNESMASLNISSQAAYAGAPPPRSYTPAVTPYDTSYAPSLLAPQPPAQPTPSSQPVPTGSSYLGASSMASQPSYDQLQYTTNTPVSDKQPVSFDPSRGHYVDKQPSWATGYESTQPYRAQDYDLNSYGVQQGQIGIYHQGSGAYHVPQNMDFDRPMPSQPPRYESSYQDKPPLSNTVSYSGGYDDDIGLGDVYAYDGGNMEPYGARGTGSSQWGNRDSYRSSLNSSRSSYGESRLPKAVPKVDSEDRNGGVQKYRVKLLSDYGSGSGPQDVLCQIGLDGVRMVSPSTNKTVRIYPLDTITRWEINEPSVFTFWAKSAVDIEPRRIRLQSGSYTTNAILDTLTAARVQFSEMVGKDGPSDVTKPTNDGDKISEQTSEKKKPAFVSWLTLNNRQSAPEEKDHWVPDEAVKKCSACGSDFGAFLRRHHCRNCGDIFCDKCTNGRTGLTADEDAPIVRVCDRCLAEVTQRLSNAKHLSRRPPPAPRTHEDLARKLQEELERNSRRSAASSNISSNAREKTGQSTVFNCNACGSISIVSGSDTRCPACGVDSSRSGTSRVSRSSSDGRRMREVACPTCTVHLQVQVPTSGTETVECGVCQHPFLVSAH